MNQSACILVIHIILKQHWEGTLAFPTCNKQEK
jgi:hypothetical protein